VVARSDIFNGEGRARVARWRGAGGARSVVNRGVDAGIGTRKGEISPSDAAPRGFDRLRTPISRPGIAPREGKTTRVPDRTAVLTP
jgi:hypothetical protein